MENTETLSYEVLMKKFQFHSNSIHFHAELAKRVGDLIRDEYSEQARESGYFTEDFFSEEKTKADSKQDGFAVGEEPQASESAAALH